jgi:hypothetical protein
MLALVVETILPAGADRASLMLIESDANGELIDLEMVGFHDVKANTSAWAHHTHLCPAPGEITDG